MNLFFCLTTLLLFAGGCMAYRLDGSLSPELQQLLHDVSQLQQQVRALQLENEELTQRILTRRQNVATQVATPVAFMAIKTVPQELNSGDLITFDSVEVNIGDGFQWGTHTFICPVTGVYYVQYHFNNGDNASQGRFASATLVMDDDYQVRAQSQVRGQNEIQMTVSQGELVTCVQGSKLFLRSDDDNNALGNNGRTSVFLGYLVYQ